MFQLATREWNLLEKNPLARITKFSDPARNGGYQVSIFTPEELHSYCSYSVALHGFVWTAEQADHSEAMLKKHYREVVTKEGGREIRHPRLKRLQSNSGNAVFVLKNPPDAFD
jgi:hypothetical protein